MFRVTAGAIAEPVSLAEVKVHVKIDEEETVEDDLLCRMITAAREYCEKYTGRSLASKTVEYGIDSFHSEISLPYGPVASVESVKYKDSNGNETTMTENTDYLVDTDGGRIILPKGKSWPSFTPYPYTPIKIAYTVGTVAPEGCKQAMLLLIGHWYANRESVLVGSISKEIEYATKALLDQYRVRWWD